MLSVVKVWKGEQVPLFKSMGLEISAQCNRSCVFCPNHDFSRPDVQMPIKMIHKVRDELSDLNYAGRWHPYMYNEPMRDERLFDILKDFRRALPRAVIGVSTNCDYLTEEKLAELIEIGVNSLTLNIYSTRDGNEDEEKVAKGVAIAAKRAKLVQSWLDKHKNVQQEGSLYTGGSARRVVGKVLHKYGVQQDSTGFGGSFKLANRSNNVAWLSHDVGERARLVRPAVSRDGSAMDGRRDPMLPRLQWHQVVREYQRSDRRRDLEFDGLAQEARRIAARRSEGPALRTVRLQWRDVQAHDTWS